MAQKRPAASGFSITAAIGALLLLAFLSTLTPQPAPTPVAAPPAATQPAQPVEPSTAPEPPPSPEPTQAPEQPSPPDAAALPTGPAPLAPPALTPQVAAAMLAALRVEPETGTAYDRELYNHWTDADKDGCSTRAEVLILESAVLTTTTTASGCTIATGSWYSPYDNVTIAAGPDLDIDHVVALGEAHYSGASTWDAGKKAAFANDLGWAGSLIAVSASSNRSKSDQDPAEWLPTHEPYRCTYVAVWTAVKWRWDLSVDAAERDAIARILAGCSAGSIVTPAK